VGFVSNIVSKNWERNAVAQKAREGKTNQERRIERKKRNG